MQKFARKRFFHTPMENMAGRLKYLGCDGTSDRKRFMSLELESSPQTGGFSLDATFGWSKGARKVSH